MREEEKVSYSRYLGRIGRYEYFTANQPVEVVMRHLEEARELIDTLSGNEGAKTSVYYEAFQIQIFISTCLVLSLLMILIKQWKLMYQIL